MALQQLDSLVTVGKLKVEPSDPTELDGFLKSGRARLADAERSDLSFESRFDLAYSAAHSFSLAALRFHGYRSESRYLVFQLLQQTVKLKADEWRVLDKAHSFRNRAEYEGHFDPDVALLDATIRVAKEVERRVIAMRQIPL